LGGFIIVAGGDILLENTSHAREIAEKANAHLCAEY